MPALRYRIAWVSPLRSKTRHNRDHGNRNRNRRNRRDRDRDRMRDRERPQDQPGYWQRKRGRFGH